MKYTFKRDAPKVMPPIYSDGNYNKYKGHYWTEQFFTCKTLFPDNLHYELCISGSNV